MNELEKMLYTDHKFTDIKMFSQFEFDCKKYIQYSILRINNEKRKHIFQYDFRSLNLKKNWNIEYMMFFSTLRDSHLEYIHN